MGRSPSKGEKTLVNGLNKQLEEELGVAFSLLVEVVATLFFFAPCIST